MTAVFIRDNFDKDNWGGRATSTALRQIIARRHRITLSVPAAVFARKYRVAKVAPAGLYDKLCGKLHRQGLIDLPLVGSVLDTTMRALGDPSPFSHDMAANAVLLDRIAKDYPSIDNLLHAIDESDCLVINLEGDGIFTRRPRHTLIMALSIAEAAILRGKKVHMLNGMLSAQPDGFVNARTIEAAAGVLERCETVVLREPESQRFAREHMPSVKTVVKADALFAWQKWFRFADDLSKGPDRSHLSAYFDGFGGPIVDRLSAPYIAIGGSSAAAWHPKRAAPAYAKLISRLKQLGLPLVVVQTCAGDAFLEGVAKDAMVDFLPARTPLPAAVATLGNAKLFISGRWHPSIMAALNGTPCVMLSSNSHKTMSLQQQLGYDDPQQFPAIPQGQDINRIVDRAAAMLDQSDELRVRLVRIAAQKAAEAASVAELL